MLATLTAFAIAATAVTLDPLLVTLIVGAVLPLAVAAATHVNAPTPVKVAVNSALSAIAGLITAATTADGTATITKTAVVSTLVGLVTSATFYEQVWKRADIANKILPAHGLGATPGAI